MDSRVRSKCKVTFTKLRELGMKDGLNAANINYLNNYLIRKSPFAPFLQSLGLSRGHQLKRAFYDKRTHGRLEDIVKLSYLFHAQHVDEHLVSFPQIERPDELWQMSQTGWAVIHQFLREEFWPLIRGVRKAKLISQGRAEEYRRSKWEDKELLKRILAMPDETLLDQIAFAHRLECPAYALCLLARKLHLKPGAQEFLERRREDIVHGFISNAAWRYYLALFHNADVFLTDETGEKLSSYYVNDGWVEQITGGISHKELHAMAQTYQYRLGSILRSLYNWDPVPDFTMGEEYAAVRQKLAEHRKLCSTATMIDDDLSIAGDITVADIPDEIKALAQRLSHIHGQVLVTSESSGRHLYIPDPELITKDGEKELYSKHMAINADKYFGLGKWNVDENPTKENQELYRKYRSKGFEVPCAMSMKTGHRTTVQDLLHILPIEQRLNMVRPIQKKVITGDSTTDKHLVYDEHGNLVPEGPGHTIPLSKLPETHPAREYLRQRGYDPDLLEKQYGVAYCDEALPEDRSVGRFWSKLPGGYKNSPQGRIIFPIIDAKGVKRGWQARAIDYSDGRGNRWFWTDKQTWVQIERDGVDLFVTDEDPQGFKKLRKYLNARGFNRNQAAFGIWQAVQLAKNIPYEQRVCYVMEGAMDAAKGGPPCIALLGKSMSDDQALVVRSHFAKVVLVADQDRAGKDFVRCISKKLEDMPILQATLPEGKKDLGDCSYTEAEAILRQALA